MPDISKYATIEPGAKIADDVKIGPFTYIGPHVRIGNGCVIESNVTIVGRTELGDRNRVSPLAVIGVGEGKGAEEGEVVIGQANSIREHATIYGGPPGQPTRLGDDNLVMISCYIGGGATVGNHGILINNTLIGAGAVLEDYVHTSGFILISPGVRVGAYTFTLGYSEIDRDAPPYAMVQGTPYRVRGVNSEKLRRCGFADSSIKAIKQAFHELYNGSGDHANADVLDRLLASDDTDIHVQRLAQSVKNSQKIT
ncbi:MAG: hypothetical protein FWE88_02755 [Phycisphaerae bacterium]|nr:hypothetical protein [Phycisphaerae bacterium]